MEGAMRVGSIPTYSRIKRVVTLRRW